MTNANLVVITPVPGVYDWNLSVTPAKDQTGSADVILSATNWAGLWTNVTVHVLVVNPVPFDGQQLDSPELAWSTAGDPPWSNETTISHDGKGAGQSGAIDSWIQTRVSGPGTLTFWWKSASDITYGFGQFTATALDRPLQASYNLSLREQWQQTTVGLPAGDWVLKWSPLWDQWYTYGTPTTFWLDQVSFTPGPGACRLSLAAAWEHSPDGNFWVDVVGEEGASYDIEVSTDLVVWSPLTRVTCSNFQAQFSDWNTESAARFYRAKRVQ